MIVIQEKDFRLEQVKDSPFFNFYKLSIINKGKDNERSEYKIEDYGLPFVECIKRIITSYLKNGEYSLVQYLEEYSKAVDRIAKLITIEKSIKSKDEEIE